jgi:hypothetical protein
MLNMFVSPDEAAAIIRSGAVAILAASEATLASLPSGQWIGGTTIYFMTDQGGVVNSDRLFCTVLDGTEEARCAHFPPAALGNLTAGRYRNGFTYLLMPAFSAAHRRYAMEAPSFAGLFTQPVMGWVTGGDVKAIGSITPKVFYGPTAQAFDNEVVVLYACLRDGISATVDTVNLFTQGLGPEIVFPQTGFTATHCKIDGVDARIADYIAVCDTKLPLVADYAGIMMNVSVSKFDTVSGEAQFLAPVISNEPYRLAQPVQDYRLAYEQHAVAIEPPEGTLSCNCVLNFLYAGLEGKSAGGYVGPVTFGEIAYILVNQTLVRLSLIQSKLAVERAVGRSVPA